MIIFCCSSCQKKLSVKDELAGKKGKCPGCGQMVAIPSRAAAPALAAMATMPPSLGPAPSRQEERTTALTHPLSSNSDATQVGNKPDSGHDSSLTDFLAPPQADDELGRLGKYRILKILGHGGMGVVYLAEDAKLKRSVAIKAMLPILAASDSAGKRFLREAQAMAAVEHDHIVRIYQVDEERGVPFLAMEFLKGEPLDERLNRPEKLPLPEVLRIGREISEALAAAHLTGLIHRDIKPANIWLEAPKNRVKILDFGLARAVSEDSGLTQQGAIMGTPAFMAPEQGRGESVDARSDLFSMGVVLYRLCTGQQPFKGKTILSTLREVDTHQPPAPSQLNADVSNELSDLVMQLLEKDAAQRPASAGVVVSMLQTLERKLAQQRDSLEDTIGVQAAPTKAAAPRRRRWPLVLAVVLLLGGLLGVGAFALIRISSEQGDYVIETDDPDFSFQVSKGAVTLEDRMTKRKHKLKVVAQKKSKGEHELEVTDADAGLAFKTKTFTIKRGEKVALKAWFQRKQEAVAVKAAIVDDPWHKKVAGLFPAQQVAAVAARLKERNPGFDGKVELKKIEHGRVAEIRFSAKGVSDISPLRALVGLKVLGCQGQSPLSDLSPLADMKLTELHCGWTQVSDLSPLKNMKLTTLGCAFTRVSDLSPLKDMKLTQLNCDHTRVTDLSPLRGLPLKSLFCDFKPERDAEILRPIKTLGTINNKPAKVFWQEVDARKP